MSSMQIDRLPAFDDNYLWGLFDPRTREAFVVDPGDSTVIENWLAEKQAVLKGILVTHHHADHVGGVQALRDRHHCRVIGPAHESRLADLLTEFVVQGDEVDIGFGKALTMEVPGHTSSHVSYYLAEQAALFCGDTLFVLGCGRMFEGTPEQFWSSLETLSTLPDNTAVYCAHEYSLGNAKFALSIDPDNRDLQDMAEAIRLARSENRPTVPGLLSQEKKANPFLRANVLGPKLYPSLAKEGPSVWFAEIRKAKDQFR
jgi:hydroxyacylglutathione hydrolase